MPDISGRSPRGESNAIATFRQLADQERRRLAKTSEPELEPLSRDAFVYKARIADTSAADRAVEAVLGRSSREVEIESGVGGFFNSVRDDVTTSRDGLMSDIKRALEREEPVMAALTWGDQDENGTTHSVHKVLLTDVKDGRVHYHNPQGLEESMALDEFTERLLDANFVSWDK